MKNTFLVVLGLFVILVIYFWKRRDLSREPFFQELYLTDSELPLEKNPEYLLPSNNTSTVPQSGGSKEGVDLYKNDKIHSYVKGDGKISFKRSEIEKVFSDQLRKFPRENNESEESYLSRFMVPILWQTVKNQFDSFSQLSSSIEQIKLDLRSANIKMVSINTEVEKLGDDTIAKKRSEEFDFKKFG